MLLVVQLQRVHTLLTHTSDKNVDSRFEIDHRLSKAALSTTEKTVESLKYVDILKGS